MVRSARPLSEHPSVPGERVQLLIWTSVPKDLEKFDYQAKLSVRQIPRKPNRDVLVVKVRRNCDDESA